MKTAQKRPPPAYHRRRPIVSAAFLCFTPQPFSRPRTSRLLQTVSNLCFSENDQKGVLRQFPIAGPLAVCSGKISRNALQLINHLSYFYLDIEAFSFTRGFHCLFPQRRLKKIQGIPHRPACSFLFHIQTLEQKQFPNTADPLYLSLPQPPWGRRSQIH